MGPVANRVAGRFVTYDRALGDGLRHGSAWIVDDATGGLAIEGRERVPAAGPLLVVANHPADSRMPWPSSRHSAATTRGS